MVWYKFSPGHSYPPAQQGYELVEGGQEARVSDEPEWACIGRLPATLARAARKLGITSIQSLWRNVLPVIALLLSASIFMVVFVGALRYIKICDLYRPSYRKIPPVSQAQIDAATSRHLTNEQCVELYPGLFE